MEQSKRARFEYKSAACEVDIFRQGRNIILRFFDPSKEQTPEQMINLVIVNDSYGFLHLKYIGEHSAIIDGYLNESFFFEPRMVQAAIDLIFELFPEAESAYVPHHVSTVKITGYDEYNGEY